MFFVKQSSNECGLHAIQNLTKSAAINGDDMESACKYIHAETGDAVHNHRGLGGDWSVSAVLQALRSRDFDVYPAVQTKQSREWSGPSMDDLVQDEAFQGIILHQPMQRHFTCIRPEEDNGEKRLYYVDSQSDGPRRISSRLATRRCLALAYAWEPFVVKGSPVEYVAQPEKKVLSAPYGMKQRPVEKPSEEFLQAWRSFSQGGQSGACPVAIGATAIS